MQSGVGMIKSGDVRITTPPGSDGPDDNDAQSHGNICLCTGDVNSGQSGAIQAHTGASDGSMSGAIELLAGTSGHGHGGNVVFAAGGAHASDVQLSDVEASVGGDLLLRGGSGVTGGGVEIQGGDATDNHGGNLNIKGEIPGRTTVVP